MTARIPEDAFDYYVGLGPARSYRAVAEKYGVTKRAVTKAAAREGWTERLAKIEEEARERSDQNLVNAMEEMQGRHIQTLRAIQRRALEALKQYPLNSAMEAVRAADLAIKLERLVAGEPSQRTAVSVEQVTRREIETLLAVEGDGTEVDDDW